MTFNSTSPYPFEVSAGRRWRTCFFVGGFVFLFLLVFQPFGLNTVKQNIFVITFGYGITCFTIMAVFNIALVLGFPNYFSEENWTILKAVIRLILIISFIGIANALYSTFIGISHFSLYTLFWFELYTLLLGIFPIGIMILVNRGRLQSKFERESHELNFIFNKPDEDLPENEIAPNETPSTRLIINSENGRDSFCLLSDDLLFIRSSDNYVEVFYLTKNGSDCKLIRNSLKNITDLLATYKQFLRCHKSYLINLKKVRFVSGNALGYKLHLSGTDLLIPVSRTLNKGIKDRLSIIRA